SSATSRCRARPSARCSSSSPGDRAPPRSASPMPGRRRRRRCRRPRLGPIAFKSSAADPTPGGAMFDLVLKGGRVPDPSTRLDSVQDVAVQDGKIARIAADIPAGEAARVIEIGGKLVTPGLIDLHAHVFEGVNRPGVNPDLGGVHAGVTTIVDAGSAGAATFASFPRNILPACHTEVS